MCQSRGGAGCQEGQEGQLGVHTLKAGWERAPGWLLEGLE